MRLTRKARARWMSRKRRSGRQETQGGEKGQEAEEGQDDEEEDGCGGGARVGGRGGGAVAGYGAGAAYPEPSRSPTPTPEPEPEPEEEDLGVWADDEDRWFTRLALDASSSPPQPPVPEESDADNAPHKSGAARTEGYYEIRIEDKLRYVTQYAERQRVAEDLKDAGNVNANNIPTGGGGASESPTKGVEQPEQQGEQSGEEQGAGGYT
ncbi:hypothetical protein BDZ89DRAFT_518168 [Hymenopellis radicata]|nr:hypothetical protein BDZ89DRAFT_518168 [Hymenopellis radicata]